ncbi:MAG: SGNH/GDSL hydrolase family protein [Magnetococcus sp. MYC-9]
MEKELPVAVVDLVAWLVTMLLRGVPREELIHRFSTHVRARLVNRIIPVIEYINFRLIDQKPHKEIYDKFAAASDFHAQLATVILDRLGPEYDKNLFLQSTYNWAKNNSANIDRASAIIQERFSSATPETIIQELSQTGTLPVYIATIMVNIAVRHPSSLASIKRFLLEIMLAYTWKVGDGTSPVRWECNVAKIKHTSLLVIGDSHSLFWAGRDMDGLSLIPGILAEYVGPSYAWSLRNEGDAGRERSFDCVRHALSHGFDGWIMLSFGACDIAWHILKKSTARKSGLLGTVTESVNGYISFIRELKQVYDKIAVWGPPIGSCAGGQTGLEKNYAAVMFTEMLRKLSGVPVLSVLSATMLDDGLANKSLFYDRMHLSKEFLPYSIDVVNYKLGINISVSNADSRRAYRQILRPSASGMFGMVRECLY